MSGDEVQAFRPNDAEPDEWWHVDDDADDGDEIAGDQCGKCGHAGWVRRPEGVRCEWDETYETYGCGVVRRVVTMPAEEVIF